MRDGHGDLLADDIFCLEDGPRILDCLEFDDDLRAVDAVDDAAVLAMDLERLDAPDLAYEFMRLFVEFAADPAPPSLRHHYIAYRAVMRAKIAAIRARQGDPDAAAEVQLLARIGLRHLQPASPALIVVGGLPGHREDDPRRRPRRHLSNASCSAPTGSARRPPAWTPTAPVQPPTPSTRPPETNRPTTCCWSAPASSSAAASRSSWTRPGRPEDAQQARDIAATGYADLRELCCVAPANVADARIRDRLAAGTDPSDATPHVAHALAATFQPWPEATVIDTVQSMVDTSQAPEAAVRLARADH